LGVPDGAGESAEINLTPLPDSYEGEVQYFVKGLALWGMMREQGTHIGTLEFVGSVSSDRQIVYQRAFANGELAVTTILMLGDGLIEVREENCLGQYGMNAHFVGFYRRA
jgi:hypothetical protein